MIKKFLLSSLGLLLAVGSGFALGQSDIQDILETQTVNCSSDTLPYSSQYDHNNKAFADSVAAFEQAYIAMLDSTNVKGVSLALVRDNQIIYTGQFGYKDLETQEPIDDETLFRIASISKSFTVTALMQLYEQGIIDIEENVNKYLPFELRNPNFPVVPITIEMLMSHLSSINDSQGYTKNFDMINPEVSGDKVALCYNDYAPGTGYMYSNLNTTLLACVLETVTGQPWYEYVEENVLVPLGLYGGYNVDRLDHDRFATIYKWDEEKEEYVPQPEAYKRPDVLDHYRLGIDSPRLSAAGGMKIDAKDLAKYMLMHMNYGKSPLSENRIISEESSHRMQTVLADKVPYAPKGRALMGLGLFRSTTNTPGVKLIGHDGGSYGLRSGMFFDPEKKFGFVMMSNVTPSKDIVKNTLSMMHNHFIAPLPQQ